MPEPSTEARGRQPPHSRESEMMVLGCMLTSLQGLNTGADTLVDEDFYLPEHRTIFKVLHHAYKHDRPVDVHLVAEELKRQNKLAECGGLPYLTQLAQFVGTSAYVEEYCELVKNKALLRRMLTASQEIERRVIAEPEDVGAALDAAQQRFFEISQSARSDLGVKIADLLSGVRSEQGTPYLSLLEQRQEAFRARGDRDPGITGLATHFHDLDRMLDGMGKSNLVILAARPAMGKTALALNIAENICFRSGLSVGLFSLEMTAEQLLHRLICSQAEVESEKLKTGALSGEEYQRIVSAVSTMGNHTMIIDDQPGLRITDLRARARRMREAHQIEMLVIDYLQLITGSGTHRSAESRQNEISEISRMLKTLARELNIPVLCLSQLSRKVEDRTQHRPMLSDLRESGCLGAESLVQLRDGQSIAIGDLARGGDHQLSVWALHQGQLGQHTLTRAFPSGRKALFRVTTQESGRSLRATANHPFYTPTGWTPLGELKEGDRVGCQSGAHIVWEQIASILPEGVEEVYDATVPQAHSFVANGFIVHNSIEQDADQVIFLLRRDYYDPLDKPGMAEIIVAKNRHGNVGTVHMTYRKELAQFGNYSPIKPGDFSAGSQGADAGPGSFQDFATALGRPSEKG